MALTRITSSVIKDSTITEGKFDTQYLNATGSPDTGQQPITLESDLNIRVGQGPTFFSASNNLLSLTAATGNVDAGPSRFLHRGGGSICIGNAQDFELYHDGSHSIINDSAGSLLVRSNIVQISTPAGSKYFKGQSGVAELYHSDSSKLATTSTGISVTGGAVLTSTDTGSSAEPEFVLYRNSASPADADYLGQIKFNGKSDTGAQRTYAKITGKILDLSLIHI